MANLLSSLMSTAGALDAYSQVLEVTQNNVANASTPGYAKQTQQLYAMRFDPGMGFTGGVRAGEVRSTRDQYAEQAVRQQTSDLGQADQNVNSLTALQSLFDISANSGIAGTLNNLLQSFSAWGQTPTSVVARQTVLQRATDLASAFQQAATGLSRLAQDTTQQLNQTAGNVNQLLGTLAGYNRQILGGDRNDAGLDAQIHSTLEELSQSVDFTATKQADGSYTILLNGEVPLLIADRTYDLRVAPEVPGAAAQYPQGPVHQKILTPDGKDVSAQVTAGQLGALLHLANVVLPGYLGDTTQPGDLNSMALQVARRVNDLLTQGYQTDGAPPVGGLPLFTYDQTNKTNVAQSLRVDASVTPDQLAAISLGPPLISNGVPLALSQLASPTDSNDKINGLSYTEFYGRMAARAGSLLNSATDKQHVQQTAVAQAQNLRQQLSGVSLDEEATILIQFQRAYEANSRLISVLNQLTQDTINILP